MHSHMLSMQLVTERLQKADVSYPSVRYFQIHFEFLHEQFQKTLRTLELLQMQISKMEQQISDYSAMQMPLENLADDKKTAPTASTTKQQ